MQIELDNERFLDCFYHKTGKGQPIVLLHGFAEDHRIFKYQVDILQENYTVITPDFPGTGASSLPLETMSMELLADFVQEILKQEKIEKTILLGHSMGGYTTLVFAEKYPNNLLAFGLIHSSALPDDDLKKENRRKSIKLIENEGKEIFLKAMIPNLYSEFSKQTKSEDMAFHLQMALDCASSSLQAYYQAMIDRRSTMHVLQTAKVPVLFVVGKCDNAVPYEQALQQSALPNQSEVHLLNFTGHTSMFENPDVLTSMIDNYCKYVLA
ncbi:MAG: alpha/beta hydrolase [Bacteroidetes bacterium]|nr:alpha/beta hydrolase [Bacteroidota bacterium]